MITPSLKAVCYQWQSTNEADRKQEMNPTKNKLTWSLLSEACAACKADEASESSTGSLRKFNEFPTFAYLRCFEAECKSKTKLALINTNPNTLGGPLSHHHHKLYQQENCSWATRLHSDTKDPFRSSNHSSPSDDSAGKLSRRNHIASQHWPSPKQHSVVANDIAFAKQTVWMFTGSKMYNKPANIYIYISYLGSSAELHQYATFLLASRPPVLLLASFAYLHTSLISRRVCIHVSHSVYLTYWLSTRLPTPRSPGPELWVDSTAASWAVPSSTCPTHPSGEPVTPTPFITDLIFIHSKHIHCMSRLYAKIIILVTMSQLLSKDTQQAAICPSWC